MSTRATKGGRTGTGAAKAGKGGRASAPRRKPRAEPAPPADPPREATPQTGRSRPQPAALELPSSGASMLDAGLKALSQARSRLTEGQEKVVQSLIDPFGIRKLEEVFDQRVAAALQRLGVPGAVDHRHLLDRLEAIDERLRRLEAASRRKT